MKEMAYTKKTLLWSAAGLLLSLLVLLVVFGGLAGEVLVTDPDGISETADAVMTCIRTGDWKSLELLVSGNPAMDPVTGEEDAAENLIWKAYQQSLQWVCAEGFDIQGPHVTQRVTVTCLDISKVTGVMAQVLLEPADGSTDPENRTQSLRAAAEQALNPNAPTMQREITLTFVRKNGQWQVVSNGALLAVLSGFTAS